MCPDDTGYFFQIFIFNYFELCPKVQILTFFNFPEHSFRGDILRISPWTLITSHLYPLPYDLYFNIQTIVPTLWYITFYLYFSMTPMNNNKLLIMFYWVPMITTGELFLIFILYGTHQTRTENCKQIIFHDVVSWKKWKKCSTILVVGPGGRVPGHTTV